MIHRLLRAACLLVAAISPAAAADAPAPEGAPAMVGDPFFDEVRIGVYNHALGSPEHGGIDLNGELLFGKPFHTDDWTESLIPRPMIGGTLNFAGKTSTVYFGAAWHFVPFDAPWFVEFTAGGSYNNGQLEDTHNDMNPLGCHWLFRESASIGYQFDEHWSVIASIEHNSNAGLCSENRGITNAGMKIGYKF